MMRSVSLILDQMSRPRPTASEQMLRAIDRRAVQLPNGSHLSYLHKGGPAMPRVIYIHGTPGSAYGWADFMVDPLPNMESIAVDRLGFGASIGQNGAVTSLKIQAASIAPLLTECNGQWPILVGHSWGGAIAAQLAASYPEKVRGLLCVGGALDPNLEKPTWAQRVFTNPKLQRFLPRHLRHTAAELLAAEMETAALAPELQKIRCPVTAIHGTYDNQVPFANTDYIRRMFTGAAHLDIQALPQQDHFIPCRNPQAIRQAILSLSLRRNG